MPVVLGDARSEQRAKDGRILMAQVFGFYGNYLVKRSLSGRGLGRAPCTHVSAYKYVLTFLARDLRNWQLISARMLLLSRTG